MAPLQEPGFDHFREPSLPRDLTYEDEMAARHSDELGAVLDQLSAVTLGITAQAKAFDQQTNILLKLTERLDATKDKTALPNWLMPLLCSAFVGLLVWIFTTSNQSTQREIERVSTKVETQDTWIRNTREQLIAHGWAVDPQGNVTAPPQANLPRK